MTIRAIRTTPEIRSIGTEDMDEKPTTANTARPWTRTTWTRTKRFRTHASSLLFSLRVSRIIARLIVYLSALANFGRLKLKPVLGPFLQHAAASLQRARWLAWLTRQIPSLHSDPNQFPKPNTAPLHPPSLQIHPLTPPPSQPTPVCSHSPSFPSATPAILQKSKPGRWSTPPSPLLPAALGAALAIFMEDKLTLPTWAWVSALSVFLAARLLAARVQRPHWARADTFPDAPRRQGTRSLSSTTRASPPVGVLRAVVIAGGTGCLFGLLHHYTDSLNGNRPSPALATAPLPTPLTLHGTVTTTPTQMSGGRNPKSEFQLELSQRSSPNLLEPKSSVLVTWIGTPPAIGDAVELRASLNRIPHARNPAQFDKSTFYRRQGLWLQATVHDAMEARIVSKNTHPSLASIGARCAAVISEQIKRGIEDRPQTHALISSMLLGLHGSALMEAKPAFRNTGTLHLFAVSGLNLSMLAGFLGTTLRLAFLNEGKAAWIILPLLILYALSTGFGPSCVRALVMSGLLLGSFWIQRPSVALNSLGGAALLILSADTNALFSIGFQLSFWLVLFLALFSKPLSGILEKIAHPDSLLPRKLWSPAQNQITRAWRPLASGAAVTSIAWGASLPWSLTLFHQLTPISLFANLVAVPIAFVNLSLGFLALLTAPLGEVTPYINRINATCAESLLTFVQWASRLPGARFPVAVPFQPVPSLIAFDLLGASCLMLRSGQTTTLLDTGSEAQARSIVIPGLQSFGIIHINTLLLSHGSAPYIGGAVPIAEELSPTQIIDSPLKDRSKTRRYIQAWLTAQKQNTQHLGAGCSLQLSPTCSLEILHPDSTQNTSITNDKCLVVRWSSPALSVLYTASAGFPTERWLLQNCKDQLRADVWVRGWHPREITGGDDFIRAVQPKVIVVSSPSFSKDSAGALLWANRWRTEGITVFLQETCGAVIGTEQDTPHSSSPVRFGVQSVLGTEYAEW